MQRSLVNFLNHGLLPFVGRTEEIERISAFWRETLQAPGLRSLLLVGEAGIGKTRLLEEIANLIGGSGGAVIQTRLYPDSSTSLGPLLSRAIERSEAAHQLLKTPPDETISAVGSALLRISSLRPTLLILEDIHLLGGAALIDFAMLLDRLSDQPLSLLCAARPVELAARGVLERTLVDEITLRGLSREEMGDVCRILLGRDVRTDLLDALEHRTVGNVLALRSALRAAVRSSDADPIALERVAMIDEGHFVEQLDRNVRLLSEGMVAHLSDEERRVASMLATLGEVFSRQTASALLDEKSEAIDTLVFKGILHTSPSSPNVLFGEQTRAPLLAFTHSLLHRYLVESAKVDVDGLLRVMEEGMPIYSVVPFALVTERTSKLTRSFESSRAALKNALLVTFYAGSSNRNWEEGIAISRFSEALLKRYRPEMSEKEAKELEATLLHYRIILLHRTDGAELMDASNRFMTLTEGATDDALVWRVWALAHRFLIVARNDHTGCAAIRDEVDRIVEAQPHLKASTAYLQFLQHMLIGAASVGHLGLREEAEARWRALVDDPTRDPEERENARFHVGRFLVTTFDTPEQLADREALMRDSETTNSRHTIAPWTKLEFGFETGRLAAVVEQAPQILPMLREQGLMRSYANSSGVFICSRVALDGNIDLAVETARRVIAELPEHFRPHLRGIVAFYLSEVVVMLGHADRARQIYDEFHVGARQAESTDPLALICRLPDLDAILSALDRTDRISLRALIASALRGEEVDRAALVEGLAEQISAPLLRLRDVSKLQMLIDLAELLDRERDMGIVREISDTIASTLTTILKWLAERSLHRIMENTVATYDGYLDKKESKKWKALLATNRESMREESSDADRRIRLSMLGEITITHPGGEPQRVRGGQLAGLLGVMAADRMLDRPLDAREFMAIAIGPERDRESARKSLNFAVFRLRELLGSDAIETGGDTPRLNPELVSIDIVEAHEHLEGAIEAMQSGVMLRAAPELMRVVEIVAGRVPFPTLYHEFFESAREEFESRLMSTIVRIARSLLRDGDAANAETILSAAYASAPEDAEIAGLLRQALTALGRRTEATRISMKAAEEAA